jgi:hypothetical protein
VQVIIEGSLRVVAAAEGGGHPKRSREAAEGGDDLGWQRHRGRRVPQCGDDMEGGELGKVRLRIWGPE